MNDSKAQWLGLRGKLKKYDVRLGTASAQDYVHDPKHLSFAISRYKFVAKMLVGFGHVVEVGCGDGFGAPLVAQGVRELTCTDIDEEQLRDNRARLAVFKNISFEYYHASENSKIGHVNLKQGEQLCALCQRYFHNVFMFGMNDEVVHTGFLPMAHYLMALCVGPREAR